MSSSEENEDFQALLRDFVEQKKLIEHLNTYADFLKREVEGAYSRLQDEVAYKSVLSDFLKRHNLDIQDLEEFLMESRANNYKV